MTPKCQNCRIRDAVFVVSVGPGHTESLCQDCKEQIVGAILMKMHAEDSAFRDLVERNQVDWFSGTNVPPYPRWHAPAKMS